MAYIFLDESGQFTKHNNEEYFVVGTFIIGDPKRTEKAFKSWHKNFPKKMRHLNEIKWSTTSIDNKLRIKTLKHISKLDVRIKYSYLLRKNIPKEYKHKGKIKSGLLYTNVIGETLDMYLPINEKELKIFCDRRHLKGLKESDFKSILKARLLPQLPSNTIIEIRMIDSSTSTNIQIADWIAGALFKYLEKRDHGKEYFSILKNNILGEGKELFKK